jgi:transposase
MDRANGVTVAGLACSTGELAHDIHAVQTLGRIWRMAADRGSGQWRSRLGSADDRQHGGARPPACDWRPKKEGPQAIGRSRGGLTSKIHAVVDALGNPGRWLLTGGEVADITQAKSLLDGLQADAVRADKGYDADVLIDSIQASGAMAVIPPKRNRMVQRSYDRHLYKDRNLVERFFNRIQQFRRIATRYEKLARNYLSFLNLVCAYLWIA